MKLDNWKYSEELEGLLFFVQKIYELTADTTDFLEKDVRLSAHEIVKEILDLVRIQENIKLDSFENEMFCLRDELVQKLKVDEVSEALLGSKRQLYINSLMDTKNIEAIKQSMEICLLRLNPKNYLGEIKNYLLSAVVDYKKKDRISHLCDRFFEVLLNGGHQKGTIHHLIKFHFFDRTGLNKIDSCGCLEEFLDRFDLEKSEYDIIFKGSRLFDEIKESCNRFRIELDDKVVPSYGKQFEKKFLKNHAGRFTYIKCANIKAVDYLHAKKMAADKVAPLSNLFVVFHHRQKPWFSDDCLIYNHFKNHVVISEKKLNPMAKGKPIDVKEVSSILKLFIKNFGLEKDSFRRFNRAVEIHSQALDSNETSSQMLSLWICLESLLVSGRKGSHLASVEKPIVNIEFNYHIRKRISNLADMLKSWNNAAFQKICNLLGETDDNKALCDLLSLKEYEEQAVEILDMLYDEPLIRYKFGFLQRIMQSKNKLSEYLSSVTKRVSWDVRRVYRARNKIVHQGDVNDHSDLLVETAHYYLDSVVMSIIWHKLIGSTINSVDNFIFEEQLVHEDKQKIIQSINASKMIGKENIRSLVFSGAGGPDAVRRKPFLKL